MPADFTQGKWKVNAHAPKGFTHADIDNIISADGIYIASVQKEADARLIAAAPELYEAVCDLLDYAYEALHLAGGENEIRGKAPRILRDIQEYQELLARIDGMEEKS